MGANPAACWLFDTDHDVKLATTKFWRERVYVVSLPLKKSKDPTQGGWKELQQPAFLSTLISGGKRYNKSGVLKIKV